MPCVCTGAAFQRFLLAKQADGEATDGGQIGAPCRSCWRAVFAEHHVQHPVLTVFDSPVFANGAPSDLACGPRSERYIRDSQVSFPSTVTQEVVTTRVRRSRHLHWGCTRGISTVCTCVPWSGRERFPDRIRVMLQTGEVPVDAILVELPHVAAQAGLVLFHATT